MKLWLWCNSLLSFFIETKPAKKKYKMCNTTLYSENLFKTVIKFAPNYSSVSNSLDMFSSIGIPHIVMIMLMNRILFVRERRFTPPEFVHMDVHDV